jgi:hypothetical protein
MTPLHASSRTAQAGGAVWAGGGRPVEGGTGTVLGDCPRDSHESGAPVPVPPLGATGTVGKPLVEAYEARQQATAHPRAAKQGATYYRRSGSLSTVQTDKHAISVTGDSALDRSAVITSLAHDLGHGWSKAVVVGVIQRYSKFANLSKLARCISGRHVPPARPRVHEARRGLKADTIAQLVADYEAGQPTPVLMTKYHLAKATVIKILKSHGITMRHQQMSQAKTSEAIQLYQQGWSLADVGAHFNRNPSTIQGVLKRAGVERRGRWERDPS